MVARRAKTLTTKDFKRITTFISIVLSGDEGARTPDLDSAIVALSQLSYIPKQTR